MKVTKEINKMNLSSYLKPSTLKTLILISWFSSTKFNKLHNAWDLKDQIQMTNNLHWLKNKSIVHQIHNFRSSNSKSLFSMRELSTNQSFNLSQWMLMKKSSLSKWWSSTKTSSKFSQFYTHSKPISFWFKFRNKNNHLVLEMNFIQVNE